MNIMTLMWLRILYIIILHFPYDTNDNYNISNPNHVYQIQTDKYVIELENQ